MDSEKWRWRTNENLGSVTSAVGFLIFAGFFTQHWVTLRPRGLPYLSFGLLSPSWRPLLQCWASLIVMGCPKPMLVTLSDMRNTGTQHGVNGGAGPGLPGFVRGLG